MSSAVNRFYDALPDPLAISQAKKIDFFAYFLLEEAGETLISPKKINDCFRACDLLPPVRTATHLSENSKGKLQKYLKLKDGYKLERHYRKELAGQLGAEKILTQTSVELRKLEQLIPEGPRRDFLSETIDCFEVKANRATIVMAWIQTLDHLFEYIMKHKLPEFNAVLAANNDKRIKVKSISRRDDFSEIPEGKFIEFCKSAKIVSKDVFKILNQKLDTRNSSAHPSGIQIKRSKVIDFVDDLITNVILKYPM